MISLLSLHEAVTNYIYIHRRILILISIVMVLLESKLVIQNQTRAQWRGVVGFHQSQFVNTAQKKNIQ